MDVGFLPLDFASGVEVEKSEAGINFAGHFSGLRYTHIRFDSRMLTMNQAL